MKPAPAIADEKRRLEALSQYSAPDTPADPAFNDLATLAAHICQTPTAFISLVGKERLWFKARVGSNLNGVERGISFCGHTIAQRGLLVVPDAARDKRFKDNPLVTSEPRIRFYAGAPLVTGDGCAVGTLCVIDRVPHKLRPGQREALEVLSREVVARLELHRRTRELSAAQTQTIRQSEQLEQLFRMSPCGLGLLDREGRYLRMNNRLAAIHGKPASACLGRALREVTPAFAPLFEPIHRCVLETGESVLNFEIHGRRGNGSEERDWLASFYPVAGSDGAIYAVACVVQEITERLQAANELLLRNQELTAVSVILRALATNLDLQTTADDALRGAVDLTHVEGGMLCVVDAGQTRLQLAASINVSPATVAELTRSPIGLEGCACGQCARTGQPVIHWDTVSAAPLLGGESIRKEGIQFRAAYPLVANGRCIAVLCLFEKSPRKPTPHNLDIVRDLCGPIALAIENARLFTSEHRARANAEASQQQLELALESARMGVWHVDLNNDRVSIIHGSGPISGLPPQLTPHSLPELLALTHPDDRETLEQALQLAVYGADYKAEFRIVMPGGNIHWVSARGRCVRDELGKPVALTGVDLDITERKQLEAQFRQVQKMEAIGQLAGGVAHDFNNLLTVIQGNAALLLDAKGLQEDDRGLVRQIAAAAERATGLTRQLLLFGRKQPPQLTLHNLNEIVGNMTKMLKRILGEDITLQSDFAPKLPAIRADAGMIEQILLNLAVNARDAMPRGGNLRVTSSVETIRQEQAARHPDVTPGFYVCLEIRDTGCGIAPEHLPRIFEPFFTTKEAGKGTGLGLATVYGIIKQHRGWIEVSSEPGQGAVFRIYLPCAAGVALASKAPASNGPLPTGNETILVVEDEPSVRLLVSNQLRRCGYTVLSAPTGAAALDLWREHKSRIQLLLTDMIMPGGMNGRELAEQLRGEKPVLKVIYTSGYSTDILGPAAASLVDGFNFLQKPYHSVKLAHAIRKCLDGVAG